jgi:hypothetical protein
MPKACPAIQTRFHQLVNMTASEIRAWSRDPRAKCASFEQTRKRLPALATLKAKRKDSWDDRDCKYAQRVVSFNARHLGQMKRFGCTLRETVALRTWGHNPGCKIPVGVKCKHTPKGPAPKRGPGDR